MKSLSLNQPHAIIMVGISGSGKSQFAEKFSDTFSAPLISVEVVTTMLNDGALAAKVVEHFIGEIAKTKASVVLETETHSRTARTDLARFLKKHGYEPLFVWVQTDPETALVRSTRSKRMNRKDFESDLKRFSTPHPSEQALVISGKHTYASQAKIVLKRLSSPRAEISSHHSQPSRNNIVVR